MTAPTTTPQTREPLTLAAPGSLSPQLREDWARLTAGTTPAWDDSPQEIDDLPEPVRRWLSRALVPGAELMTAAVLRQHGELRAVGWQQFDAHWALSPADGFIWSATMRVGPVSVAVLDSYTHGTGETSWRLFGRLPLGGRTGPDLSRGDAGRLAAEMCFVPSRALSTAVRWEAVDQDHAVAHVHARGWTHRVTVTVADSGRLERLDVVRWGASDGPAPHPHRFTVLLDGPELTQDGVTISTRCRAGWWMCEDGCADSELIRFTVLDARFR